MERPFVIENARELQRLRALVNRLSDEELSLPIGGGWTVASALAHLAFWDQRALVLMRKWEKTGVGASPVDVDVTNDALLALCLEIPPGKAASLAVSAAEAIDREVERAPDALILAIGGLEGRFRLYRADHRKAHVDQIEALLQTTY